MVWQGWKWCKSHTMAFTLGLSSRPPSSPSPTLGPAEIGSRRSRKGVETKSRLSPDESETEETEKPRTSLYFNKLASFAPMIWQFSRLPEIKVLKCTFPIVLLVCVHVVYLYFTFRVSVVLKTLNDYINVSWWGGLVVSMFHRVLWDRLQAERMDGWMFPKVQNM